MPYPILLVLGDLGISLLPGLARPAQVVAYIHEEVAFAGLSMRTFQVG